jgi:hypothetical protein
MEKISAKGFNAGEMTSKETLGIERISSNSKHSYMGDDSKIVSNQNRCIKE